MTRSLWVAACFALACRGYGSSGSSSQSGQAAHGRPSAPAATPVSVAQVRRATLAVRVTGPGETDAPVVGNVRAPFAGVLADLLVQDGDQVAAGQVVGHLVSRESVAALEGAHAMQRAARTEQERRDAARALGLARGSRVTFALRAPEAGVVVTHKGSAGGLVAQDEDVVVIAATRAIVFVARIDQAELSRIRPGNAAAVEIPAIQEKLPGRVHSILATANASTFSSPVRIDFTTAARPRSPGLFGTVTIVVAEVRDALVVPAAAVLRDDVTGVTRIATVTASGVAHWIDVKTGIEEGGLVQLEAAKVVAPGDRVITSGLVGLPEGTHVEVQP